MSELRIHLTRKTFVSIFNFSYLFVFECITAQKRQTDGHSDKHTDSRVQRARLHCSALRYYYRKDVNYRCDRWWLHYSDRTRRNTTCRWLST